MNIHSIYRKGVGAFIINNNNNKIFMAKRIDFENEWQMPQGGMDNDESPLQALFRELLEEIGTNKFTVIHSSPYLKYNFPSYAQKSIFNGKYIGQKQKWFFLKSSENENNINLAYSSSPEFVAWEWVSKEDLLNRIVDFKKPLYKELVKIALEKNIIS